MPESKSQSSCELPVTKPVKSDNRNRHYSYLGNYTWKGVPQKKYKTEGEDWSGIIRQVLVGDRGETPGFHLRYFEILSGGYSSYETHRHEHVVICIRGKGSVRLNRKSREVGMLDVIYINPDTPHRFLNPYREPFGFFCIVNADRDRPKPVKA